MRASLVFPYTHHENQDLEDFRIFRIRLFVGCGDDWDLEDLDSWMDANIFAISAAHQHPNPENANQDFRIFKIDRIRLCEGCEGY